MVEVPAIDALRELLERQLRAIERAEPGVRDGADPEDLHRFRVAVRRSRALIRASRPLVRDQLAGLDRDLRWLGGVSGPVRDLDVLIEHLHELLDELEPDTAGAELVVVALERERLVQQDTLVRAIASDRYRTLRARFAEAALPRSPRSTRRSACAASPARSSSGCAAPTRSSGRTRPTRSFTRCGSRPSTPATRPSSPPASRGARSRRSPRRRATSRT